MTPQLLGAVLLGGSLGALARYGVDLLIRQVFQGPFPLATFLINVSGSFLLAFFVFASYFGVSPAVQLALGTGLLGAFTTFSTFELETLRLLGEGQQLIALSYFVASVIVGLFAALAGRWLALQLTG